MPSEAIRALGQELAAIVGSRGVIQSPAQLLPYESDGLALIHERPELVVLPRSTEEAALVYAALHRARVPVVARGSGTGLTGGATPVEGGVVVATTRMRQILEFNPEDRYARVQAGVVNADLSITSHSKNLIYAPDPSSQMACTIGGNVANNSGGPHCFKYGSTTRHVLGLKLVLHDGEILDLSQPDLDPLGLDLVGLFVGSEGTFGLATEVTVQLVPAPEVVEVLLVLFDNLDAACDTVSRIIQERLEPSAMEILDRLTIQAVEASVFAAGYPTEAEAVLLVEVEGSDAEVQGSSAEIRAIVESFGSIELRSARDPEERRKLWAGRKGAFGAMGRVAPDLYVADAVVPRTKLRELVRSTSKICAERNLKLANVFHAGDGNLHPNICYDRRDAEEVARVLEAGRLILETCVASGGTLSGEHGVGLEKIGEIELVFTPSDLASMCRVREVWDPERRMNPGKLLPIRCCGELHTPRPGVRSDAPAQDPQGAQHGS